MKRLLRLLHNGSRYIEAVMLIAIIIMSLVLAWKQIIQPQIVPVLTDFWKSLGL